MRCDKKPKKAGNLSPKISRIGFLITAGLLFSFTSTNCGKDSPTGFVAPTAPTAPTAPATPIPSRVTIAPAMATLNAIGQSIKLDANVLDTNNRSIPAATVTWSSAISAVANVNAQGLVTAVGNGSTLITARAGNLTATANITVAQTAGRITITPTTATLDAIGHTIQLNANVVDPSNSPLQNPLVAWSSANPAVATVNDQGLVTAVGNGSTLITARAGNLTATANIAVAQAARQITVTPTLVTLNAAAQTTQLIATVSDANNSPMPNVVVSWSSANAAVATVNDRGLVTAVDNGSVPVTATAGSLTGTANVTVMGLDHERKTLVKLYNATGGPNWTNKSGWLSDRPLGSWYGVTADESGNVTELSLGQNNLQGALIPELGQLTNLTELWLYRNELTGTIPSEIGQLDKLVVLALAENQVTGTIPPEIGQLTNLTQLGLSENQLTGTIPPEIGQLKNLTWLVLSDNLLTGPIPPEIGQLTNLTRLYLRNNRLTGAVPPELGQLINLASILLWDNQLSGTIPPELGQLAKLSQLWLHNNYLTGTIPPEIGQLTNLSQLLLSNNHLSGTIPPELGQLAKLSQLWLHNNYLTGTIPPEIGQLTNLRELLLSDNQLSGTIPPELGQLTNLRQLLLSNNQLSGTISPKLQQLINLTKLGLSGTQVCVPTDAGFTDWLSGILENDVFRCTPVP